MARLRQPTLEPLQPDENLDTRPGFETYVKPVTDPMQAARDIVSGKTTFTAGQSSAYDHALNKVYQAGELQNIPKGYEVKNGQIQHHRNWTHNPLIVAALGLGGVAALPILGGLGLGAAAASGGGAAPALSSIPTGAALTGAGGGFLGGGAGITGASLAAPALAGAGGAAGAGSALVNGSTMSGIGFGAPSAPASAMSGVTMGGPAAAAGAHGMGSVLPWVKTALDFIGGLGGDDQGREAPTKPYFEGSGPTDPRNMMFNLLQSLYPLAGAQMNNLNKGVSLPGANVPQGPPPVNIPGLPFQIGGGLGMDPAARGNGSLPGLALPTQLIQALMGGGSTHPQLPSGSGTASPGLRSPSAPAPHGSAFNKSRLRRPQ